MKKKAKKLRVHRETLRNLGDRPLRQAVGGAPTLNPGQCQTSCVCRDDPGTFSAECTLECPTTSNP